jgi:hypothetical protein
MVLRKREDRTQDQLGPFVPVLEGVSDRPPKHLAVLRQR